MEAFVALTGALLIGVGCYIAFKSGSEITLLFSLIVVNWGIMFLQAARLEGIINKLKKNKILKWDD